MTIRCFRKQGRFIQGNIDKVNANLRMDFHNNGSNEWLGFRLEFMGCFVLCVSALFLILLPSTLIKPGILFSNILVVNVDWQYSLIMLAFLCFCDSHLIVEMRTDLK